MPRKNQPPVARVESARYRWKNYDNVSGARNTSTRIVIVRLSTICRLTLRDRQMLGKTCSCGCNSLANMARIKGGYDTFQFFARIFLIQFSIFFISFYFLFFFLFHFISSAKMARYRETLNPDCRLHFTNETISLFQEAEAAR